MDFSTLEPLPTETQGAGLLRGWTRVTIARTGVDLDIGCRPAIKTLRGASRSAGAKQAAPEWLRVLILVEFQSKVEHDMALRVQGYVQRMHEKAWKQRHVRRMDRLPPVLAVVFYNGTSPWRAERSVWDLTEKRALRKRDREVTRMPVGMRYELVDVTQHAGKSLSQDNIVELMISTELLGKDLDPAAVHSILEAQGRLLGSVAAGPAQGAGAAAGLDAADDRPDRRRFGHIGGHGADARDAEVGQDADVHRGMRPRISSQAAGRGRCRGPCRGAAGATERSLPPGPAKARSQRRERLGEADRGHRRLRFAVGDGRPDHRLQRRRRVRDTIARARVVRSSSAVTHNAAGASSALGGEGPRRTGSPVGRRGRVNVPISASSVNVHKLNLASADRTLRCRGGPTTQVRNGRQLVNALHKLKEQSCLRPCLGGALGPCAVEVVRQPKNPVPPRTA